MESEILSPLLWTVVDEKQEPGPCNIVSLPLQFSTFIVEKAYNFSVCVRLIPQSTASMLLVRKKGNRYQDLGITVGEEAAFRARWEQSWFAGAFSGKGTPSAGVTVE